jgi:hypothetical protein
MIEKILNYFGYFKREENQVQPQLPAAPAEFDKTGWSPWPIYGECGWADYPLRKCPIEIMRNEYDKPRLILDSRQLPAAFNVAGLYWRPRPIYLSAHEEELAAFDKELKANRHC